MKLAARAQAIEPFYVMEVAKQARALEAQWVLEAAQSNTAAARMIYLNIGEPDFGAPAAVQAAAAAAMAQGHTQYTPALGLPALREAISRWYLQRFGVQLQQGFAQGLQGIAFFFLVGAGGVVGIAQAFEFGFEFQIAGTAFGNEFAFDVIAFFWFAGHE